MTALLVVAAGCDRIFPFARPLVPSDGASPTDAQVDASIARDSAGDIPGTRDSAGEGAALRDAQRPDMFTPAALPGMAQAQLVLEVQLPSSLDLAAIAKATLNMESRVEGSCAGWRKPDGSRTFHFAACTSGYFYYGVSGKIADLLHLFLSGAVWRPRELNLRTIDFGARLNAELGGLRGAGLVPPYEASTLPLRIWSGLPKPLEAIYSFLVLMEEATGFNSTTQCPTPNCEWKWKEVMDYWAPAPEPTTYSGELWRQFKVSCPGSEASYLYLLAHSDVLLRAYVEKDGVRVVDQQGYGDKSYASAAGCPQKLKLGGTRTSSEIDVAAYLVNYGGPIETSEHAEYPGGGSYPNPSPSKLVVGPGWNAFSENPPASNPPASNPPAQNP